MNKISLVLLFVISICLAVPHISSGQGNLIPPPEAFGSGGGPKALMRTLNQVEPRRPIEKLPCTITNSGAYFFTRNLSSATADGIIIQCSDVSIDMNGFALNGGGSANIGITAQPDTRRISVRNGVIRGWGGGGILANASYDGQLENIKTYTNGLASADDIYVGKSWAVTRCISYLAGQHGIRVYALSSVKDCIAIGARLSGIYGGVQCRITDSTTYGCKEAGIRIDQNSTVKGCQVSDNPGHGIMATSQNRITRNNCTGNGDKGAGAGVYISGHGNRIEGNTVSYNEYGIQVIGTNNLVVKNSATGNAVKAYDISTSSRAGRILDLRDLPAEFSSSEPWANFSF